MFYFAKQCKQDSLYEKGNNSDQKSSKSLIFEKSITKFEVIGSNENSSLN